VEVSILVLVDFSLKLEMGKQVMHLNHCFNPCFGGFFSKTIPQNRARSKKSRFNPCFGGFFSKTQKANIEDILIPLGVSILVLVDFSLKLLGLLIA